MGATPLSTGFQSLPPLPTIKLGPSGAASRVGGFVHILGPCGSLLWPLLWGCELPVRLGVSPAVAATPTGVFNQTFEALFLRVGTLGCVVCHPVHQLLPRQPAAALPTLFYNLPPRWVCQWRPCRESSPPLCSSTPPTDLHEYVFFISFVVRLPYSLIFCQFWLFFVFKLLLSFFWLCEKAQCVYLCLHFGWRSLILDFWTSELWDKLVLFETTKFVEICYKSKRKLIITEEEDT